MFDLLTPFPFHGIALHRQPMPSQRNLLRWVAPRAPFATNGMRIGLFCSLALGRCEAWYRSHHVYNITCLTTLSYCLLLSSSACLLRQRQIYLAGVVYSSFIEKREASILVGGLRNKWRKLNSTSSYAIGIGVTMPRNVRRRTRDRRHRNGSQQPCKQHAMLNRSNTWAWSQASA